jgi:hypothetical protein
MYKPCNPTQNNDLNYELWNTIPSVQNLSTAEEHQQNKYNIIKNWLKQGIDTLPKSNPKDKNKRFELSAKSREILDERKQAARDRNPQLFLQLNKEFTKARKEDKKNRVLESISKELDIRDRWLGIKELKRKYTPTPYHNKDNHGLHIKHKQRAQHAAKYLSGTQWGNSSSNIEPTPSQNTTPIIDHNTQNYNIEPPTLEEITRVIRKIKRRKAPGPDNIPTELLKELRAENLEEIRKLFEDRWNHEDIDKEELKARVVLIYKKGDTNNFENYRPISLLNTLYKIFAAVLQRRISDKLDKHLQKTQFGFRKDKSTGDAIHLIRRIIEFGESTQNELYLVLLDWEKAFDKVDRKQLFISMERMGVNQKLINLTKSYTEKQNFV